MKHAPRNSDACLREQGFTLLELLVTSVMIAVLTIIGIVSYSSVNKRSRDVKRKSDLEQIRSALEMYRSDNGGEYPTAGAGAPTTVSDLAAFLVPTYVPAVPNDSSATYYYQGIQTNSLYSSYCVSAKLETISAVQSTCTVSLPPDYNYGLKNP